MEIYTAVARVRPATSHPLFDGETKRQGRCTCRTDRQRSVGQLLQRHQAIRRDLQMKSIYGATCSEIMVSTFVSLPICIAPAFGRYQNQIHSHTQLLRPCRSHAYRIYIENALTRAKSMPAYQSKKPKLSSAPLLTKPLQTPRNGKFVR